MIAGWRSRAAVARRAAAMRARKLACSRRKNRASGVVASSAACRAARAARSAWSSGAAVLMDATLWPRHERLLRGLPVDRRHPRAVVAVADRVRDLGVDVREVVGAQLHVDGGEVLLEVLA